MKYTIPPHFENKVDLLWIVFSEKELLSQNSYARGAGALQTKTTDNVWKFLAPSDFMENVNHIWNDYESVSTRLAEKGLSTIRGLTDIEGALSGAKAGFLQAKEDYSKGGQVAQSLKNIGSQVLQNGAGVLPAKVDAAYAYQNSNRREFTFIFHLSLTTSESSNGYNDVYLPVLELKKASCATLGDNALQFGFPNIFSVYSYPSDIIKINNAAITSVQPTWYAPFIAGYPSKCELTVTVVDIEPLYRQSFESGGIITVEDGSTPTQINTGIKEGY